MTIQGAMNELINLLNADDIPIYYKGCIKKVIETIDDYIGGGDDYVKRRADRKTEPTISKMEQVDEPQTGEHCNTCRHKDECEGATYEYKNTEWWCLAYAPIEDEPQTEREGE